MAPRIDIITIGAGDLAAGSSAALLATKEPVRAELYLFGSDRPVGNCRGRPRRPSPGHHSLCPLHHRRRAMYRIFCVRGSPSAPLTKNFVADTQRHATKTRRLKPAAGRLHRFSSEDETCVRELWLKRPGQSRCAETIHTGHMTGNVLNRENLSYGGGRDEDVTKM